MSSTSSAPPRIRTHTVRPLSTHTHTIIFLHDRGSDATEFALRLFDSHESSTRLSLRDTFPSFKWVFPYAPASTVTNEMNTNGSGTSAWFNDQGSNLNRSVAALVQLVQKEIKEGGIPAHHIFCAGLGQGIALAAHALLHLDAPLAGLMGFNGWLPLREQVHVIATGHDWDGTLGSITALSGSDQHSTSGELQLETPVFLSHSRNDPVVPFASGADLRDTLKALGMKVEWHEYINGGHWFQEPRGIDDFAAFLRKSIAKHYMMDKRLSRPVIPTDLRFPEEDLKAVA